MVHFFLGNYIYVGSALKGLEARVIRHFKTSRGLHNVLHWHIDYLLKEPCVSLDAVYIQETDKKTECIVADEVSKKGEPVCGFGCSDCKCVSHLFKVNDFKFLEELGLKTLL